jgi:adenylate cyclase
MSEEPPQPAVAETRKLAAIMFTDMVSFSRQMGANEARMLRLLEVHNQLIQQAVAEHHGVVIKVMGDAFLVDFPSVVHAVQCAQQIQSRLRIHNAENAKDEQIHVRIGIHLGDIVQKDGDVFGDGVNIAARLQALAESDTICISEIVYKEVVKKIDLGAVVPLGRPHLKNIAERFPIYALLPEPPNGFRQKLQVQRLKLSRRVRPAHRLAVVGLLLVSLTLVAVHYFPFSSLDTQHVPRTTPESLPFPDKPSIVVLPFTNMSNDSEQDYFSDGITEDITSDLSKISSLFVIARNSAFTYKGKATKVQDISREMGVRYVLEGSVRKADNQVRITTQLIDGATGGSLWSERYDRSFKDIFALQDEIVQKIVTTLKLQLTLWEQGVLVRKSTDSIEAYDFFLRGLEYQFHFTKEENVQARQMFEKAIELDPRYARAYATLGLVHWLAWIWQWTQDPQALEHAFAMGRKAVELDDSLPSAHMILSQVLLWKKQYELAIAEGERATTIDPSYAEAYRSLAEVLYFCGKPEEGIKLMEQAIRLNPRHPPTYEFMLGVNYRSAGRYEEAIQMLKQALARNPNIVNAHFNLAVTYSEVNREEEAKAEVAEALRLSPEWSLERWRQNVPFKNPAEIERFVVALRKAGLK